MEKKQRDWKFIIGMILLVLILGFMIVSFWLMVAKQAQEVKEEEARVEAQAISAIFIYYGDFTETGIFINMDTKEVFQAEIPRAGIWNRNDRLISGDVLEDGDEVRIYGDGVLSEEDPPVYENITKMQRIGRATLEEAQEYREIAEAYGE